MSAYDPLAECMNALFQLVLQIVGWVFKIVFNLLFPFTALTLVGLSYVLTNLLHLREFGLWFALGILGFDSARQNIWLALTAGALALAAVPLVWVAYSEQQVVISMTIKRWLIAAGLAAATLWLDMSWPYDRSDEQLLAFGILMLVAWTALIQAMLPTLGIITHIRANRPPKSRPPEQAPHGGSVPRLRRDPETI
jgi:hypothetical protein